MANWDKHQVKGMSREELERRVRDGLKKWEARGWVRPGFNLPVKKGTAIATAAEPTLERAGMRRVMRCADLAIYALANGSRQDYLEAVRVINATRRLAGMSSTFMKAMCEGIAEAASAASGEPLERLNMLARTWLHADLNGDAGGRLISLPSKGANDDGQSSEGEAGDAGEEGEAGSTGGSGSDAGQAPGEGHEPEPLAREGGQGAGREGGREPADGAHPGGSGSVGGGAPRPGE